MGFQKFSKIRFFFHFRKKRSFEWTFHLATHFCDVVFFCFWEVFKTNSVDHVIRGDFKNIFKHVQMLLDYFIRLLNQTSDQVDKNHINYHENQI